MGKGYVQGEAPPGAGHTTLVSNTVSASSCECGLQLQHLCASLCRCIAEWEQNRIPTYKLIHLPRGTSPRGRARGNTQRTKGRPTPVSATTTRPPPVLKGRPRQVTHLQVHLCGERGRLHLREQLGGLWVLQRRHAWIARRGVLRDLKVCLSVRGQQSRLSFRSFLTPRMLESQARGVEWATSCPRPTRARRRWLGTPPPPPPRPPHLPPPGMSRSSQPRAARRARRRWQVIPPSGATQEPSRGSGRAAARYSEGGGGTGGTVAMLPR